MFMQAFENKFIYDLTTPSTTLSMVISAQTPADFGVYIGSNAFTADTNPFTLLEGSTPQIYINTDVA